MNPIVLRATSASILANALALGPQGCSPPPGPPPADLTVEQTMGLAFAKFIDTPVWNYYAAAAPEARRPLRLLIADPRLKSYHEDAWTLLGYVGDESDVRRVSASIEEWSNRTLDIDERRTLYAMIHALGLMGRRDVAGARELLIEMHSPDYWRKAQFQLYDRPTTGMPPDEYLLVIQAVRGYALASLPDAEDRARSVVRSIDDPEIRESVAAAIDAKQLADWVEYVRREEQRPALPEMLPRLERMFNGDLDAPGPATADGSP